MTILLDPFFVFQTATEFQSSCPWLSRRRPTRWRGGWCGAGTGLAGRFPGAVVVLLEVRLVGQAGPRPCLELLARYTAAFLGIQVTLAGQHCIEHGNS